MTSRTVFLTSSLMPGRSGSPFIDTIDSNMAPAFLGLLLFGRKESCRWLATMSFTFLGVFSCQFAKEILRDRIIPAYAGSTSSVSRGIA